MCKMMLLGLSFSLVAVAGCTGRSQQVPFPKSIEIVPTASTDDNLHFRLQSGSDPIPKHSITIYLPDFNGYKEECHTDSDGKITI